MVKCGIEDNMSCCISCISCSARLLKIVGNIQGGIDSFKDDGIEYIPVSTVDYWINMIRKNINEE